MTDGMYGLCRHPIYAGLITACVGISFFSESPERLLTRLLLTGALSCLLWYKADREEALLEANYGAAYLDWAANVPPFFPAPQALFADVRFRGSESAIGGLLSSAVVISIFYFAAMPDLDKPFFSDVKAKTSISKSVKK